MRFYLYFLTFFLLPFGNLCASDVKFTGEKKLFSDTGYLSLSWENNSDKAVIIQKSTTSNFTDSDLIYKGKNKSLFLSGLRDGTYYFRISTEDAEDTPQNLQNISISDSLTLVVKHHSMTKAWILFSLGAFIFLSIIFVIIKGEKIAK